MAHYAFIDSNNVVVNVIVGVDENITQLDNGIEVGGSSEAWEQFYESQEWNAGLTCKRTSYNNNIRKQYATIDGTYNSEADVFIKPQSFPSWTLDANHDWQPPTPKPEGNYRWNEAELVWVAI
jgi:hypothetical protein